MYSIDIDAKHELVEVTLGGMLTVDDVLAYTADLKRAFVRHQLRSYVLIVDICNCPIQQQDMLKSMGQHMATMPKARAIAIISGSSLARMQARRMFTQPYARVTLTKAAARAWVTAGVEPDAQPRRAAG